MPGKTSLFITYKATSELDFIVPLIWKMKKEDPSAKIAVLYGVINKKMLLRESTFYSDFFKKHDVAEYDLGDFMFRSFPRIRDFLKKRFANSYWDGITEKGTGLVKRAFNKIVKFIDRTITSLIDYEYLFSSFQPDRIFFALRGYLPPMKQKFYDYTYKANVPVFLYPQGAFASSGSYDVSYGVKRNECDRTIPEFAEVWYSFSQEFVAERYPDIKDQCHYVGYTGLDSEWLNYLAADNDKRENKLKCLFIIRKFVRNNSDDWVFDHDEFMPIARAVVDSLKKTGLEITLVVKPHPSNDFEKVKNVFSRLGYDNLEVTYESIYEVMGNCDFAISISSTVMLVPAVYGMPVIFLNSSVKDTFERWEPMKDLFGDLEFYVESLNDLNSTVSKVVSGLQNEAEIENLIKNDVHHFRKFFPDGSADLCLKRLGEIVKV